MKQRTEEEYYIESRRLREETIRMADALKDNPMRFVVTNVITMDVEITKSDLKTIVSKNTGIFKPYAIIDQKTFDADIQNLKK
jgi:Tfp pilus assembly PilM family ATPase